MMNYKDRLALLNFISLEARRVRELVETFKLLNGMNKIDFRIFLKIIGGL